VNFSTFATEQDGGLLRVSFNNPPINLMNLTMVEELFQLAGMLVTDPEIKVVVLDSADPDFFIAHFDLQDLEASVTDESKASKYPEINALQSLSLSWQALPQITIAKVNGCCRGGGLEFIMGLTMRFASTESRFCFPEASGGFLASGGGATRTAMTLGPARAMEVLLSARDFSGEEAERYGLINRALAVEELDAYLDDLTERLLRRSRDVIAMHKAVANKVYEPMVDAMFDALAAENDSMRAGLQGREMQEGMVALLKSGQTRESELDLPATIAQFPPFVP
jgi:enoyl-CoA hydratase/carnithine racemase